MGAARARATFTGLEASAKSSFAGIRASAARFGAFLGIAFGGVAIVGALKRIVTIGADFQYTMATVGGVMRATATEMENLTGIAKRMGETTEFTASQAGEALRFLGMAGFEAAEAIEALPGVLDLATAGGLDLGRSADIVSNALTAMNLPVKELTRVNDVFIGTITRSNVNMEQMAESFKYAAPVAKAYGYNIEELSGLIGALGDAGIQGSMAGTSLARAILDASKVAGEMGYETSDLVDVLQKLRDAGEDNISIMGRFELRAAKAVGVLVDRLPEIRRFQETLTGVTGESQKLAETMRSTVKGSFAELKSVIQSVAIDAFERFGASLTDNLRALIAWIRRNRTQIVDFVTSIAAGINAVAKTVGTVVSIVGSFTGAIDRHFRSIDQGMIGAAERIADSGEQIRAALQPPPLTD